MPEDWIREEIRRLRNWRHDSVDPALRAVALLKDAVESFGGRTAAIERRLTKVEEDVRAMATADEVASRVAKAMKEQRGGILTRRQRWVGYAAVLAAVVGAVFPIVRALT